MEQSYQASTPEGLTAALVSTDIYRNLKPCEQVGMFYEDGYVVVPDAVPRDLCDRLIQIYNQEFKPEELARRALGDSRENSGFEENGLLMKEVTRKRIELSGVESLKSICQMVGDHPGLRKAANNLLKSELSNYSFFESCSGSGMHRDIDSTREYLEEIENPSEDIPFFGAWISLTDIPYNGSRLYVVPGSPDLVPPKIIPTALVESLEEASRQAGGELDMTDGVQQYSNRKYEKRFSQWVVQQGLELHAPLLKAGDVIFFKHRMIHGSTTGEAVEAQRLATFHTPIS